MDTKDVKALKTETEEKILNLLREFSDRASLDIIAVSLDDVKMTSSNPDRDDYTRTTSVKIEVEI